MQCKYIVNSEEAEVLRNVAIILEVQNEYEQILENDYNFSYRPEFKYYLSYLKNIEEKVSISLFYRTETGTLISFEKHIFEDFKKVILKDLIDYTSYDELNIQKDVNLIEYKVDLCTKLNKIVEGMKIIESSQDTFTNFVNAQQKKSLLVESMQTFD